MKVHDGTAVNDEIYDRTMTELLSAHEARGIPPTADLWPAIQTRLIDRRREQGRLRARLLPRFRMQLPTSGMRWVLGTAALAVLLCSAGAALALAPLTRPVVIRTIPANLVHSGSPPAHPHPLLPGEAPPVYVIAATPEPGMAMTVAGAEQKAGFHVVRSVNDNAVQLLAAAYLPPVTEIAGQPVANPQPKVRLTYRFADTTVTVEEWHILHPGQPFQVVHLGNPDPHQTVEKAEGAEFVVNRAPDDRHVLHVSFATDSTVVGVQFVPPSVDWGTAYAFIAHLQ